MKNSHEEKIMKKTINYFFMLPCIKQGEKICTEKQRQWETQNLSKTQKKTS